MDFGDDDFCLNITQSSGKPAKSAVPKATAESSSVGRPEKKPKQTKAGSQVTQLYSQFKK